MNFSKIKNNKWVRFFSNRYVLILIFFIVWMIVFDTNSYLIHRELDKEIEGLENNAGYHMTEWEPGQYIAPARFDGTAYTFDSTAITFDNKT